MIPAALAAVILEDRTRKYLGAFCVSLTSKGDGKKPVLAAVRSRLIKGQGEDSFFKPADQKLRWLAEHKRNEALEKALSDVGKFIYEPAEYGEFILQKPFEPPPRTDFSPLLTNRLRQIEEQYNKQLKYRWVGMVAPFAGFAVFPGAISFVIAALLGAGVGASQYALIEQKKKLLASTEEATRHEVKMLELAEDAQNETAKKAHEEAENVRSDYHLRLLSGDTSAMLVKLDEVLPKIRLPFPISMDIDIYLGIILLCVWLPPKTTIPQERSRFNSDDQLIYEKKDSVEINRQYVDLTAGVVMQVIATVFSYLPNFSRACVRGMTSEYEREDCLWDVTLDRPALLSVENRSSALSALQGLSAKYSSDEFLKLMPVQVYPPKEWEHVETRELRSLHVKVIQ